MHQAHQDNLKERDILFSPFHPDREQAVTAALVLKEIPGVLDAGACSNIHAKVRYDLHQINLQELEELLSELGFHLSCDLLYRIKRALYHYTEGTQQALHGYQHSDPHITRNIFIERYHRLTHECQDTKPDIWRHYR